MVKSSEKTSVSKSNLSPSGPSMKGYLRCPLASILSDAEKQASPLAFIVLAKDKGLKLHFRSH